jgi:hypothetical protein
MRNRYPASKTAGGKLREAFTHPAARSSASEREPNASEADNHVTLGLGEDAVYG